MHCSKLGRFNQQCDAFDPAIDFAAQRAEIDRLGQKRFSAVFQRLAVTIIYPQTKKVFPQPPCIVAY